MKFRLKTRQKEIQDRIAKKRIKKERKEFIDSFPKTERDKVEELLIEMESHHKSQNKYGAVSLLAIGAFFLMYSYGFLTWNILTQIAAGVTFALFVYSFSQMVVSAWKGDRCKRNLAFMRKLHKEGTP